MKNISEHEYFITFLIAVTPEKVESVFKRTQIIGKAVANHNIAKTAMRYIAARVAYRQRIRLLRIETKLGKHSGCKGMENSADALLVITNGYRHKTNIG